MGNRIRCYPGKTTPPIFPTLQAQAEKTADKLGTKAPRQGGGGAKGAGEPETNTARSELLPAENQKGRGGEISSGKAGAFGRGRDLAVATKEGDLLLAPRAQRTAAVTSARVGVAAAY